MYKEWNNFKRYLHRGFETRFFDLSPPSNVLQNPGLGSKTPGSETSEPGVVNPTRGFKPKYEGYDVTPTSKMGRVRPLTARHTLLTEPS